MKNNIAISETLSVMALFSLEEEKKKSICTLVL